MLAGGLELAKGEAPLATRTGWDVERVEDVPLIVDEMGDHAAVYDSGGVLHVAYGGDHLYYARCAAGSCTVDTVDPSEYVGAYASLALDSLGRPHIAYYDMGIQDYCDDEKVKYARWDGSLWRIQVVAESCLGKYPSIAVDAQGNAYISYYDEMSDELQLADWDGSNWHTFTPSWLPYFEVSGHPSSLMADQLGRLHLAFIAGHPGDMTLWYIRKDGDTWGSLVEIDASEGASKLGMALDSSGNPHLSYNHRHYDSGLNAYVDKLRYVRANGATWLAPEELADMDYQGWTSTMIGSDGYPRLAYKVNNGIGYIIKSISGWGSPAAVPDTTNPERMYLGPASTNTVGLTFYSGGVITNTRNGSPSYVWSSPLEIDQTGWVGYHIAAVASPVGELHVVYTDQSERELHYARRSVSGAWQTEMILQTANNDYVYAADIDVDTNGHPHIIYENYNSNNQTHVLKYRAWSGNAWLDMGVASQAAHSGCDPSLELDTANIVYIAYTDCNYIDDNLVLAQYDGSWHYDTIDPDPNTITPSLVVNDQGFLYVSYINYDYPDSKLRFAKNEGSVDWGIIDVADTEARSTSLALDSSGKPRIAYLVDNYPDYVVRLAHWDGLQWLIETVKDTVYWGETRLVIDSQDRWHVAFSNWSDPVYAVKEGANWVITDPIDSPPADPDLSFLETSYTAIALDGDEMPVVLFNGEYDLKAAQMVEEHLLYLPLTIR
jgi:hypothetical protein